jgi:hypothetical protein
LRPASLGGQIGTDTARSSGMEQMILNVVLLMIVAIIFWVASRSMV